MARLWHDYQVTVWTEGRTCTISSLTQLLPIQCFTNHEQVLLWQYPFISGVRAPSRPRPGVVSQLFFSCFLGGGVGGSIYFFPRYERLGVWWEVVWSWLIPPLSPPLAGKKESWKSPVLWSEVGEEGSSSWVSPSISQFLYRWIQSVQLDSFKMAACQLAAKRSLLRSNLIDCVTSRIFCRLKMQGIVACSW